MTVTPFYRVGNSFDFFSYFLQTEAGTIKRISVPIALRDVMLHLTMHPEGRAPSHLDTETRQLLERNPHYSYGEAFLEIVHGYVDTDDFHRAYNALSDEENGKAVRRYHRIMDGREAIWREENGEDGQTFVATFN